uniref:Uncharacterized protein n=1 Tax=Panagrolaimus sp. ES5 TaxID=591445 RepID=A0AC34FYZ0_9BILA
MSKSEISLSIPSNEDAFLFENGRKYGSGGGKKQNYLFSCISRSTLLAILKRTALIGSLPFIFLYIIVPLLFHFTPLFTQHIFFLNFVKVPFVDYQNVSSHGVKSLARHFFLQEKGAKVLSNGQEPILGVWHVLPMELSKKFEEPIATGQRSALKNEEFEKLLSADSHGIVVYFHGNSFDRTNPHRVDLYNRLSAMNFHVL